MCLAGAEEVAAALMLLLGHGLLEDATAFFVDAASGSKPDDAKVCASWLLSASFVSVELAFRAV